MMINLLEKSKLANILVVDDDLNNLRFLTKILTERGYIVRPIRSGKIALAAVEAELPDLILLDIMMPSPNGYEVCAQLKENEKSRSIPVIFLSALSETLDKVKGFTVGGVDYITKPFQIEEVIARIENQLKISRLQKQLAEQNEQLQLEIRERQLLEQKLRSSEAEIRGFFEAMADIVLIVDSNGKTLKVAPTHPEKLYPPEIDMLGETVKQFFGEQTEVFRTHIQRALATQQVVNHEYHLKIGQDSIWFAASITPTSENTVAWVARDISDRKKAEEALQESAEREKALSIVIQKMRQSLDIDTIFMTTTSELRQVVNCDRVLVYQFNPDWTGKFVAESVGHQWNSVLESSDSLLPNYWITEDNCKIKNLINIQPLEEDIFSPINNGFLENPGIHYLAVTDIYQSNFSPCYIQMLEQLQAQAYLIVPIFCGTQLWGLLGAYQNKHPYQWQETEISIIVHIGNQLGIALQQAQLLEQTQKQSEALQKAVLAADAANRAKSEFLASMSHELRTPLNAILGFTQVMNRDISLSGENQKTLEIINRAGEHLLALIDDILEVSKIEAGRTTFNQSSFNLMQMLTSLDKMLQLKASCKGLELTFEYLENIPTHIKTDEGKLRQVLVNLLGNAIKFTQTGQVILRVSGHPRFIVAEASPQNLNDPRLTPAKNSLPLLPSDLITHPFDLILNFEIEDTGPGISPQEKHLLFEPFGQTETGRKSGEGTGLGLVISRKYVQLMGGDIQVSSTLGQGSLFSFQIPITLANESEVSTKQPPRKVISLAANQSECRILVVDDLLESRLLLTSILSSIGFSVAEATNGQEAVTLWETWQPHLILMDIKMPVMDGYEATQEIRKKAQQKNILSAHHLKFNNLEKPLNTSVNKTMIIALSASAFDEEKKLFLSAGCDDLIRKPFQIETLLEKLSDYLEIQYEYENEVDLPVDPKEASSSIITDATVVSLLSQMPTEWLSKIYNAACRCSDDKILELIQQIPTEKADLVTVLTELAENFLFEKIMLFVQTASDRNQV